MINSVYSASLQFFFSRRTTLDDKPWFNGVLNRSDANQRVLRGKTGTFLIRKSPKTLALSTRLVLTVNFFGEAQHILFTKRPDEKRCFIIVDDNYYYFKNIENMINYFKLHPLYLIGSEEGTVLTDYIVRTDPIYV